MSKRTTKADVILEGARERIRLAQLRVDTAKAGVMELQTDVDIATAVLKAHTDALTELEKDLTRKPADDKGKGKGRPAGSKNRGLPKDTAKTPPQIGELAKPNGGDTDNAG